MNGKIGFNTRKYKLFFKEILVLNYNSFLSRIVIGLTSLILTSNTSEVVVDIFVKSGGIDLLSVEIL